MDKEYSRGKNRKFEPLDIDELARRDIPGPLPTGREQSLHNELLQKVSEMGFRKEDLKQVPATVRNLTVADLNDFARKLAGVKEINPVVDRLTIRDIQGIEYLFGTTKEAALTRIAASGFDDLRAVEGVDVSCCCCTPCCCCAATEVDPFAA